MLNKVENRTIKSFDKEVSHGSYKTGAADDTTVSLILLQAQRIQINVSILYANTTGFIIVVVGWGTGKHPIFRGNGQSKGFFFSFSFFAMVMVMNGCGYI